MPPGLLPLARKAPAVHLGRIRRVMGRGLALRCPACGEGSVFEGAFRMRAQCAACGLGFEREPGYFVGAIYINYGLTVLAAVAGYFLLDLWLGPPVGWQLGVWAPFAVLFPLWSYRYSKTLWLALDHLVDPAAPGAGREAER